MAGDTHLFYLSGDRTHVLLCNKSRSYVFLFRYFFLHVHISQFKKGETIDQIPFEVKNHIGNNMET